MFRKFFLSRQTAPTEIISSEPVTVREDFILTEDVSQMTVSKILSILRRDTIEFTEKYNLTWGVTDFVIHNVPVRVKLTENQDVWYYVDGELVFNAQQAVELIKSQAVTF